MRLELTGRHIQITPQFRAIVADGLAHSLRKLNSSAVSVQVVLTREKTRMHAEATLHVKGERFLHGEASGRDPQTALAAVLQKLDRQAQKVKNKWTDGKRQGVSAAKAGSAAPRPERAGRRFDGGGAAGGDEVRIVRARRYAVKPMSVDEAAMEVGDAPNAFLVFRDAASESINILFRRADGNLGLIEPEG